MRRGDIVTVALAGDHGKPRPAVIIQADRTADIASVLVCLCTSRIEETSNYRLRVEPTPLNGLLKPTLVQAEKIHAVTRTKCGPVMGHLTPGQISDIDNRLSFILGLGD
ncbi:MAG: type II toxin-antitoxin system PemK/MazF family toxin [Caulobacteraceae bacterium]|nr:type II toxin-antitoxin system PemK/MazF family toxin [Caulobacteraceae bacterium]